MFETALATKIKGIFDIKKVTYNSPTEDSVEQECAFVEVETPRCKVKDGREIARVRGKILIFVNAEKMPFDFFSKQIDKASPELNQDLFFFDIGLSEGRFMNLDARTVGFEFFFNSQYDPNLGTFESFNTSEGET